VFLKETVGPLRWSALIVGFLGVLLITSPGVDTFQAGSLFALGNAILFGTVTIGVRGMTETELTETSTMYRMVFLTAFFTAALPFGWSPRTHPTPENTALEPLEELRVAHARAPRARGARHGRRQAQYHSLRRGEATTTF
jgi:drug/metabolite transporter (DMT)-like permease